MPTLPKSLHPIGTISPSGAGNVILNDGCRFKLLVQAWSNRFNPIRNKNGIQKMLPDSGASVFGTIAHAVLDWANRNESDEIYGPCSGAMELWDRLIQDKNNQLLREPMNTHLVPLAYEKGYLRKRGRICHFAEKIRKESKPSILTPPLCSGGKQDSRLSGTEVSVKNSISNPIVSGKIDLIIDDGTNLEILDWKMGHILDDNDEIKIEYKVQLQLYAALLERKQIDLGVSPARFPIKATLENPETGQIEILESSQLEPDLCRRILDEAIEIHRDINASVMKNDDTNDLMIDLANPSIDGCRFCPIRPACGAYLDELKKWMKDVDEETEDIGVQDVIGEFISKHLSEPRSSIGAIIIKDSSNREWRIAGIDIGADRNQSTLENIRKYDIISVFNIYNNPGCKLSGYIHAKANLRTHIVYAV